jgi:hypothetical protein
MSTPTSNHLKGARVYLSGPMDFVASRADEKKLGWRNRVSDLLKSFGSTVFDPWFKPGVRGLHEYGLEDVHSIDARERWSFDEGAEGDQARSHCAKNFWQTLHIDLRMVDTSDLTIAYVPTNIYSVGTVHEIVLARQQLKPVLFVSPPVQFPALQKLKEHLKDDAAGLELLQQLEREVPIKANPRGIPSLWYMPLIGGSCFFDGFGFSAYRERFGWERIHLDDLEEKYPPRRPLLPFLESLMATLPQRWDDKLKRYEPDDDWLLWDL